MSSPTSSPTPPTFDAVLLISFGGPQGSDDIRPFLANVLRGRRVPPERVEEVAHHYELFKGVSPITDITKRQAAGLASRLATAGHPLPVYVGMRNWHPFLADTFREMRAAGVRRAIGFIAAAQHSYSSCEQYRENVAAARAALDGAWFAVETGAGRRHVDATFSQGDVLLFGSERRGLPPGVLAQILPQNVISLPMRAGNRSLNLANAVAVVVYEAWRQHDFAGASGNASTSETPHV